MPTVAFVYDHPVVPYQLQHKSRNDPYPSQHRHFSCTSLFISLATTASSSRWSTLIFSLFFLRFLHFLQHLPHCLLPSHLRCLWLSASPPFRFSYRRNIFFLISSTKQGHNLPYSLFTIDCSSAFSCSASFFSSTFFQINVLKTVPVHHLLAPVSTPSAISLISSALYWLISVPSSSAFFCRASSAPLFLLFLRNLGYL